MFVSNKKYKALQEELECVKEECSSVIRAGGKLYGELETAERTIDALQSRLRSLDDIKEPKGFTKDTLKQLRTLIHPDKHNGSQIATDLFILINKTLGK